MRYLMRSSFFFLLYNRPVPFSSFRWFIVASVLEGTAEGTDDRKWLLKAMLIRTIVVGEMELRDAVSK